MDDVISNQTIDARDDCGVEASNGLFSVEDSFIRRVSYPNHFQFISVWHCGGVWAQNGIDVNEVETSLLDGVTRCGVVITNVAV